jgi:Rrf2 family protein
MIRLGRQVESALIAIKALNESFGSDVPISDICLKYGLSKNTLSKIMQSLSSSKLIESSQGTRGGYKITTPVEGISFFDVLDSLGEIKNLKCRDGESCSLSNNCSISSPLVKWELKFEEHLKSTPLSELLYDTPILTPHSQPQTHQRSI